MKILVIGGGGREHALVWKIAQSPRVAKLYAAPGNAGMARHAECVEINAENSQALLQFAKEKQIDLTVVGPEGPLVGGIVDLFQSQGLRVFGPTQRAAQLEGSKSFAKALMRKHAIPTGEFQIFDNPERAKAQIETLTLPLVIKADGLAAGKGVQVCRTKEEAFAAIDANLREKRFGAAGDRIVMEQYLPGQEVSVLMFVDGNTIAALPAAQDHKTIGEGDAGPNTGGMGAYCPTPFLHRRLEAQIEREILVPIVHAMNQEERPYCGILYTGLMITREGAKVLEFNCRFGDPETQPILVRMKTDLVDILDAVVDRKLDKLPPIEWDSRAAVCVVMASGGYPGSYSKGFPIQGLEEAEAIQDVFVFHAGTEQRGASVVTSGGRVLGVTALGEGLRAARARAYEAVNRIQFEAHYFRKDIGAKALSS